jgi:protein SCO1/2
MTIQRLLLLAGVLFVLGLTATVATFWIHETTGNQAHTLAMQQALHNVLPPRTPRFALNGHNGGKVTEQDFRGRLMLVYFGYTQCVDVCPYDMAAAGRALDILGPRSATVQPLFITIDPANDTPALLAKYVPLFHPRLIGLTGSMAQLKAAADSFGASFDKEPIPRFTGHGHSANLYLIGRKGEFLRAFRTPTTGEVIAEVIRLYL